MCQSNAILESSQRARLVTRRSGRREQAGQSPVAPLVGSEHRRRGAGGRLSEKVASSHRPIHWIDADGGEPKKLRGNVQVAAESREGAYVIDMSLAVLDA